MPDKAMNKIHSERGLAVKVAAACGITRHAIDQWDRVPIHQVHSVAAIIDMTPEQIRPDIFLPPKKRR
jgi:hypothetical protein